MGFFTRQGQGRGQAMLLAAVAAAVVFLGAGAAAGQSGIMLNKHNRRGTTAADDTTTAQTREERRNARLNRANRRGAATTDDTTTAAQTQNATTTPEPTPEPTPAPTTTPIPAPTQAVATAPAQTSDDAENIIVADYVPDTTKPTPASVKNSQGKVIVGPLLKTQWGQQVPFNSMFPVCTTKAGWNCDNDYVVGKHPRTGCPMVAFAQIMKYYNHPKRGKGQTEPTEIPGAGVIPSINLEEVEFDWDNMLNTYTKDATEKQRNAVASLFKHLYAGGVAWYIVKIQHGIVSHFGYDKSLQKLYRRYYTDAEWETLIRKHLDSGIPVFIGSGAHAWVVDGYDNQGKFHFNFGWNGYHDGYYSVTDLNIPGVGDFTDNQWNNAAIYIMKPDEGGVAAYTPALDSFAVAKTSVTQNELFTINARINTQALFPISGQTGAALMDKKGNITTVVGTADLKNWLFSLNYYVPETVKPGQYTLRIVTRPEGGKWEPVTLSDHKKNVPTAIDFIVTEERGAKGGGYGMALTEFSASKTAVLQNELFAVKFKAKNIDSTNFPGGQYGAALVDNGGNIAAVVGTMSNSTVMEPGWAYQVLTINGYAPETVKPGRYKLRLVVKSKGKEEWRVASLAFDNVPTAIDFTVTEEIGVKGGGYGMSLTAFSVSKASLMQKESFTVKFKAKNIFPTTFPGGQYGAALMDNGGNILSVVGTISNSMVMEPGWSYKELTINGSVPETVKPGLYRLRIVVKAKDKEEWRVASLSEPKVPTAIDVYVDPPNAPGYDMALRDFDSDKDYVFCNEPFVASVKMENKGKAFPGGNVGAVLVDDENKIVAAIGEKNVREVKSGDNFDTKINCCVPNSVKPGRYRLRAVIRADGQDGWIVGATGNMAGGSINNTVVFTVKPGSAPSSSGGCDAPASSGGDVTAFDEFSPADFPGSAAKGGDYGVAAFEFSSDKAAVIHDEPFNVRIKVNKLGDDKFPGELGGVALMDGGGKILSVISSTNESKFKAAYYFRNSNSVVKMTSKIPNTVPPGKYRLRIVVKPEGGGDWKLSAKPPADAPNSLEVEVR